MKIEYIVNIEIFNGTQSTGWGNLPLTVTGGIPSADEFYEAVKKEAHRLAISDDHKIRIVGVFKL